MKFRQGMVIVLVFFLTGCIGTSTSVDPPTISPLTPSLPASSTNTPLTQPATSAPLTIQPVTVAQPTRNPATRSPATRPATATAPPSKPAQPRPIPASPTADLGKFPPLTGSPEAATPEQPGWTLHENATYGFTFSYPAERWIILERPNDPHGLAVVHRESGIALRMRFARAGENANLQLYGGAAGEFVPEGTVRFMGQEVERSALVYQGDTTRVFYNNTEPIARGDMLYSFALVGLEDQTAAASLPEAVQAEADRIIETFVEMD